MPRPRVAALLVGALLGPTVLLAGCQGDDPSDPSESSTVEAFPEPPSVSGPLAVELRPALRLVSEAECEPDLDAGQLCSPDGGSGYRVLGTTRSVVVTRVSTAPSGDRTSWGTTVRFAAGSRGEVRQARDQAAGLGGVVAVTVGPDVITVIEPPDLRPGRATLFGLEKSEAWALVDAFADAQTGSKQGM